MATAEAADLLADMDLDLRMVAGAAVRAVGMVAADSKVVEEEDKDREVDREVEMEGEVA